LTSSKTRSTSSKSTGRQFLETQRIYDRVQEDGPSILPITVVDDEIVAEGEYLSYDELTAAIDGNAAPQEA